MKSLWIVLFCALCSLNALASSESCAQLKQELKSMHKAQSMMMASLVNNHESFASTLEEYSHAANTAQMNKSAQAFRLRGLQGKKMANQLDKATADLVQRAIACL